MGWIRKFYGLCSDHCVNELILIRAVSFVLYHLLLGCAAKEQFTFVGVWLQLDVGSNEACLEPLMSAESDIPLKLSLETKVAAVCL